MTQKIQIRGIVIGILFLFISACLIPFISIVQAEISWDVTIQCDASGGLHDYVVFGEAPDANDGPPVDISYDVSKPPANPIPYIRACFNDSLPKPYDTLTNDIRYNSDTSKIWNLTVQWMPSSGSSPTTITLSWNTTDVDNSEYNVVNLCNEIGTPLQNMLINSTYVFSCPAYVPQNFKIICTANNPPAIPSNPSGPTALNTGQSGLYSTSATDPDGNQVQYMFDWDANGAHSYSSWTSLVASGMSGTISHSWSSAGTYVVKAKARDAQGLESISWSNGLTVVVSVTANYPPMFGATSPMNGSTVSQLSLTWTIPINDPENDSFNWTIQCSNGQATNANTAFNGTKSLSLSGLAYVTTYKIWVNATDPTGSANYTRKWYTFTTRSSGGGGGGGDGDDEPSNIKPNADLSAREPYQGYVNTEITFDGSKSNDSDGTITKWFWVFGDNTNGTGNTVRHTYSKTGTYTVTLTVTDNEGATNTDTTTCVIIQYNGSNNSPTTPVINGTRTGIKNKTYTYSIYSTDQNNDSLQYITTWGDGTQNTSNFLQNGTIFSVSHTWVAPGKYMITAIATDNMSISDQGTFSVFIDVFFVRELGFLFDSNNDGLNDSFYTNSTGLITPAQKLANESYLIDTDSDGISNYLYNPSLNALTELKKIEITAEFPWVYVALLLVVVVIVSCVAVFYLYQYGYI